MVHDPRAVAAGAAKAGEFSPQASRPTRAIKSQRLDNRWAVSAVIGAALTASQMGRSGHHEEPSGGIEVAGLPPLDGSAVTEDDFVIVRMIRWQPIMMWLRHRARRGRHTDHYAGGTRAND